MPGAGSPGADAISAGRREMLTDTLRKQIKSLAERGLTRPRIGADALCEALLRQGVDVLSVSPAASCCRCTTSSAITRSCATSWSDTSRAPLMLQTATLGHPPCRRLPGHIWPRRDEPGTGIGNAMLDSVPMVALTGNVVSSLLGKDAFQEIDITGITLRAPSTTTWSATPTTSLASSPRPSISPRPAGRPVTST